MINLANLKNIVAKKLGSSNPLNHLDQVRATFKALESLRNRKENLEIRGKA